MFVGNAKASSLNLTITNDFKTNTSASKYFLDNSLHNLLNENMPFEKNGSYTRTYVYTDACGQQLTFTVLCRGTADDCSASKMLATATAYKNAHTNAQGCFFL